MNALTATKPNKAAIRKITKSTPLFVAIYYPYMPIEASSKRIVAKTALHFAGDGGPFVRPNLGGGSVEIAAGQTFYFVRADSLGKDYFYIMLVGVFGAKKCSCPAHKPCKHELAVQTREAARIAPQMPAECPVNAYDLGIGLEQDKELQELLALADEALAGFYPDANAVQADTTLEEACEIIAHDAFTAVPAGYELTESEEDEYQRYRSYELGLGIYA